MKNKLDPRQYTPYSMDTVSGNLYFVEGVDFWECYLLENITGAFNIAGSLAINSSPIYYFDSSNNVGGTRPQILAGTNNLLTGTDNALIGTSNSQVSGQGNTVVGGSYNQVIGANNTVGIGSYTLPQHNGAMVLGDSSFSTKPSRNVDSISINFTGGMFVDHKSYFDDEIWLTGGNLYVSGQNSIFDGDFSITGSGYWSGQMNFEGIAYQTGSKLQNLQDLKDTSGDLVTLINLSSGTHEAESANFENTVLFRTGDNQEISGSNVFVNETYIGSGWALAGTGSNNRLIMDTYNGALGYHASGRFTNSFNLVINHGGGGIAAPSGENLFMEKSLSVLNNAHNLVFGVNTSGQMFSREGITSTGSSLPTNYDSPGVSGQILWDKQYIYFCTGWNHGAGAPRFDSGWGRLSHGATW